MATLIDYEYKPTVGKAVSDLKSIDNGNALTIQPPAGETWVIEMITYGAACKIEFTDGTLSNTIDEPTEAGVIEKAGYRITNTHYITVTNTSGGSAVFGYSGYKVNEA